MSPTRSALLWLGAWLALALGAAWLPELVPVWIVAGVVLGVAGAADGARLFAAGPFEAERELPSSLAAGTWTRASLRVHNRGRRSVRLIAHDHVPASMQVRGLPRSVRIPADAYVDLSYRIYPSARGAFSVESAELAVRSPLGLWRRKRRVGSAQPVRVYPNFRHVMRYSLLATENRTSQLGIRRRPRRGEGLEFHQLREYREGDSMRQIDWKVTARVRKTISREYQDERDQQIVFLLDCGRKMHSRDGELSHFDHALDSVLLLAHVGLRQGDAVGLLTFSGERRWLAPRKGKSHLNPIMNTVFDLQTSSKASDYLAAAQDLLGRIRKRALIVLVTNLRDEDHEELVLCARLLGRKHLVLLASMKERVLARALDAPIRSADDALRVAATHQYVASRRRAHDQLVRGGILALDVEPQQLAVTLVNGYLDIKSRGLL